MWFDVGILGPLGSLTQQTPCAQRGCLTQAEFESEESQAIAFMNYLLDWLEAEPRITRWYWFHWDWAPNRTINHVVNLNTFQNALHSFFEDIDEPNLAAINYAKRAGSPILYNRSFEVQTVAGAPYAWGFWAGGPGDDYAYGTTTAASHTGVQSLHIRVGAQAGEFGNVASARQPIYSQHYNGKLARVEAWCQTTSPTQAAIKVNPTGVNGIRNTNWTPGLSEAATCPDWQKIHTGWFILPHDTLSFEVELVGTGGPGEVWFDDVELVLAGDLNRSLAITADDLELLAVQRIGWNDIEPTLLSESEFPAEEWTSVLNYMRDAAQSLAARVIEQPE